MLRAVRNARADLRIVLSLLPCPFASGQELRIARGLGFDAPTTVPEYLAFAAGGPHPATYQGSSGLVLQLGGDAMHAIRITQRLERPETAQAVLLLCIVGMALISAFIGGRLADRVGRVRIAVAGALIQALAATGFALSRDYGTTLGCGLVFGLGCVPGGGLGARFGGAALTLEFRT